MRILIVGYGVVGKSLHYDLRHHHISIVDPDLGFPLSKLKDSHFDAMFLCLPTPTNNGDQSISLFERYLGGTMSVTTDLNVIKSSILPSHAELLCSAYPNVIVAPEFLNQSFPYRHEAERHIIGVNDIACVEFYREMFEVYRPKVKVYDPKTAMMIKYVHNVFGATKVAFFNEIFDVCSEEQIDYRSLIAGLLHVNDNINEQYTRMSVDGKRGFGGACFPKDIAAFTKTYKNATIAKCAQTKNRVYRPDEMEVVE